MDEKDFVESVNREPGCFGHVNEGTWACDVCLDFFDCKRKSKQKG